MITPENMKQRIISMCDNP